MTFDTTKYSHLDDDEILRLVLTAPSRGSDIELSLAIRLEDAKRTWLNHDRDEATE